MGTTERLINYKRSLNLREKSQKLFDFVVEYLGLEDLSAKTPLPNAFDPWFGPSNDRVRPDDLTQYSDGRIHQKYKIALEFCALEAGLPSIVGYVESRNRFRPASMLRFWFHGRHPSPVRWILRGSSHIRDMIIAEGVEKQGSLNIDTVEDWLTDHIAKLKEANEQAEQMERSRASNSESLRPSIEEEGGPEPDSLQDEAE